MHRQHHKALPRVRSSLKPVAVHAWMRAFAAMFQQAVVLVALEVFWRHPRRGGCSGGNQDDWVAAGLHLQQQRRAKLLASPCLVMAAVVGSQLCLP